MADEENADGQDDPNYVGVAPEYKNAAYDVDKPLVGDDDDAYKKAKEYEDQHAVVAPGQDVENDDSASSDDSKSSDDTSKSSKASSGDTGSSSGDTGSAASGSTGSDAK